MKHVSLPDFLDIIEYDFDTDSLTDYKAIGDKTAIRDMKGKKYRRNYERGILMAAIAEKFERTSLLEIGTGRGYVAACVEKMSNVERIATVDRSSSDDARKLIKQCGIDTSNIEFVKGNANKMKPSDFTGRFDFFFIDGQHDGPSVQSNYALCQGLAEPKSIVVFDDYRNKFPSIKKVIDRMRLKNAYLVHTDGWYIENACIKQAKDADYVKDGREHGSGMVVCFED